MFSPSATTVKPLTDDLRVIIDQGRSAAPAPGVDIDVLQPLKPTHPEIISYKPPHAVSSP